jgi:predicted TIM-barrel fold metal-dependent hydrolase
VVPNLRFGFQFLPLWQNEKVRDQSWYLDFSLGEVRNGLGALVEQSGSKHVVFGTHVPFSYPGAALVKRALLSVDVETGEDIDHRNAEKILGLVA